MIIIRRPRLPGGLSLISCHGGAGKLYSHGLRVRAELYGGKPMWWPCKRVVGPVGCQAPSPPARQYRSKVVVSVQDSDYFSWQIGEAATRGARQIFASPAMRSKVPSLRRRDFREGLKSCRGGPPPVVPSSQGLTGECTVAEDPGLPVISRERSDREILDSSPPLRSGSE